MDFEILINSSLVDLGMAGELEPAINKWLLTLVNDFEDGHWRSDKFDNFVWDNIAETALSASERDALSGQPASLLSAAAKNLRLTDSDTDVGRGSELAEIVLYGIMRHQYGALPVVPKIFHKQNVQDNAKGADSVHIVLDEKEGFTLWFGEAKFYTSIEDARLGSIVTSVKNSLITEKLKKENSLITNLPELDSLGLDTGLVESIKEALSYRNSIDNIKPRINIPILLLHECDLTKNADAKTEDYLGNVCDYHRDRAAAYFKKQIAGLVDVHMYEEIRFHLILFPVPEKAPIVDSFLAGVTYHKGS